jgi:pimeloyl-ACP methyl ester carboxylesterase
MLPAIALHPEGPRYGASIVYLPGLWLGPETLRPAASYFGHRGWAGTVLDVRGVEGGIGARADAVTEHVRRAEAPPVLVAHDAGALVALGVAARTPVRALVLASPLRPGAPGTHALVWSRSLVWSLLRRRPVPPPRGPVGAAFLEGMSSDAVEAMRAEDPRVLSALSRRTGLGAPPVMPPTLVLRGVLDPIVSADDARGFAAELGADLEELPRRGHRLLAGAAWQEAVPRVHRWLVRCLGEANLELYAEAMADRDEVDEP